MPAVPRRILFPALIACAAGTLLGVTYTLSPATVWFWVAMAGMFAWAGRGLSRREQIWVFGLLSVAVALRVLALIAIFFGTYREDGLFTAIIPDEAYIAQRSLWLRNIALRIPVAPADFFAAFDSYGESGVLWILAYLQILIGPASHGIRLFNAALYLIAAVALYRTIRPRFGPPAAIGGLGIVLFMPSMFVWSISALKEPAYIFLTAMSVVAAMAAVRADTISRRTLAIFACVIALLTLETIRDAASIMVGGGIVGGLLLATLIRKPVLLLTSLVFTIVIGAYALQMPRVQTRATSLFHTVVESHIGHVKTRGWSYKLLDPVFYTRRDQPRINYSAAVKTMTAADTARYIVRAAASFVLVPLPWAVSSTPALAFLPEQMVWYVLVVLAAIGSVAGVRRDTQLAFVLLGVVALSGAVIGLTNGNIGTLVRFRGMAFMPMAWLSSLGACAVLEQIAARCRGPEEIPRQNVAGV